MKHDHLLLQLVVLVTAMMCALGAAAAEAYACYTPSNTTLTFYYDNQRSSRTGTTYDLNTGYIDTGWESDGTNANVSKVVFDPSFADARPTTTYAWFSEMNNLQSIQGLRYLNTSQVTNMRWMFGGCRSLTAIDVAGFNTSKVTDMYAMFNSCWNLRGLDLTSFNTSKVTDMRAMFFSCGSLQTIYVLDGWTTAAVTQSSSMFEYCSDLVGGNGTTYDANHIDAAYAHIDGYNYGPGYFTIPINNEPYACYTYDNTLSFHCDRIRSFRSTRTYDLNTGDSDPDWLNDGTYAYEDVTQVVIDPSFANASPTSTSSWFFGMENLQSIQGLRHLNTNMVTDMSNMFYDCNALTSLDLSGFLTSRVTDMSFMFSGCTNLKSLDLTRFNTSKVTNMQNMFFYCNHLETIIVGDNWSTAAVTLSDYMFYNCINLVGGQGTTFDASHMDKTYAHLDYGTSNPGYFTARLEAYVMYNGSAMALTFYYDNQRKYRTTTTYDLNTGTDNPEWLSSVPQGRVNHVVFDPSFAGARPSSTWHWFAEMINLQDVTGMEYLNTSNVGYMGYMFYDCMTLTALDLSNFNTADVVRTDYMFYNCNNLRTIFGGDGWNTNRVALSTNMFYSCTKLTGDQGTTYDASHVNKAYAHLDGGTSNPGYFSRFKEAYACYTPSNTTLTFYYDNQRNGRSGRTYDLNTTSSPAWGTDGTNANVTKVVFDPSFAGTYPTSTFGWFSSMTNLESITGMEYLNTDFVNNLGYMFCRCSKLTSIDLSHFNTSRVVELDYMFYKCSQLTVLDLSSFNTSMVAYMNLMFADCSNLKTIYAGEGWTTSAVEYADYMFRNCTSLVGGQGTTYNVHNIGKAYAHIDGGPSNPGYFTDKSAMPEAYACYTSSNTTLTFYYDSQRSSRTGTTYDLNEGGSNTGWDTDGTKYNVTKVVFDPSFANARPTTTCDWFYCMTKLESITGMSYLNTSEVTNMNWMFMECYKLTSLDLSHFNTSKVTRMTQMFAGCTGLTSLDLSHFNTSKVTYMNKMFEGSTNLRTIVADSGWSTAAVTYSSNMFDGCTSLVGGQGTTYDANHIDAAYAHIDGGPSNPGYFTAKNAGLRGDVNGDGQVNPTDATVLINALLNENLSSINTANADMDSNGTINVTDAIQLINYLLTL